jgi:hypothetical protein
VKLKSKYVLDAVTSSGMAFEKQKLDRTFNFAKQGVIDFYKILKSDNVASEASKNQV